MKFKDILYKFRTESFTEKEKGTKFERLMRSWLLTDPRYNELKQVWLWEDFPGRINSALSHEKPLNDKSLSYSDLFSISLNFAKRLKSKDMRIAETVRFPNRNPA